MSINLENNTVDIGYSDNPGDTDFGQIITTISNISL